MSRKAEIPEQLKRELDEVLPIVAEALRADYSLNAIDEIEVNPDAVILKGGIEFYSENLAEILNGSISILAIATTLGSGVDELADRFGGEGRLTAQTIVDAAGSAAIERMTAALQAELAGSYWDNGFTLTRRYSPGYGDFNLDYQPQVLELSGGYEIGITLTENNMMLPLKSVTALIGLRTDG